MAKLYKRGSRYYLGWEEDGERFRRSLGKIDRQAAQAVQAEKEAELAGLITSTRGVTVSQVIATYMDWYEHARPTTFRSATSTFKPFLLRFGGLSAEGLNPHHVELWEVKQKARGSAHKAMKLSKAAFRQAIRSGLLKTNPMDRVQATAPPISRAPDYYRQAELDLLYACERGPLWQFMVNTGLRRGEMIKARRADIRDGQIIIESTAEGRTKSGKWRAVPLNRSALAALAHLGDERLTACRHVDTLGDWFALDRDACGLRGSLHWTRHTFCTALVQQDVSLYDVQRLAGHSSIQVTEQYARHAPGHGVSAVSKLDEWHQKVHKKVHTPKQA
ncbi:MAG: tyrosine-type recombinase/integrase [Rhodanobacter sp.]